MRQYLSLKGDGTSDRNKYGHGPNFRMRVIRQTLSMLGVEEDFLRHGINREVFAMPVADNWQEYLTGETNRCRIRRPTVLTIARAVAKRWIIQHAIRKPEWAYWSERDRAALFDRLVFGDNNFLL